ncbi:similar to An13g01980 [Aspergillus luchuensis IFO 4308]|nr:similar to An13g01980 [Aspergillus luchuensis IFO 4308]
MLCRFVKRPFWGAVIVLGLLKIASLFWSGLVYLFPDDLDARLDAWVFPAGRPSIFSHWTTHGVVPVRCHSHNDYWRDVPLHSALTAGCIGVEADVWPSNDELLVGHTPFTLHHEVTLRSLYLNPLLDLLQKHNTRSSQLEPAHHPGSFRAGVFSSDPSQTLVLLIDFKEQPEATWSMVMEQLQPLRDSDYLTYFNGTDVITRPLTVVATGDAPFDRITSNQTYRDIFYDAPLDQLALLPPSTEQSDRPNPEADPTYSYKNSYYASVDFRKTIGSLSRNRFSQGQLELVRKQVEAAHARGLKVRYWGTPSWPRGLRNHVWHVLVREGVDLINVDDLREATRQDWRKHRSWFF